MNKSEKLYAAAHSPIPLQPATGIRKWALRLLSPIWIPLAIIGFFLLCLSMNLPPEAKKN